MKLGWVSQIEKSAENWCEANSHYVIKSGNVRSRLSKFQFCHFMLKFFCKVLPIENEKMKKCTYVARNLVL